MTHLRIAVTTAAWIALAGASSLYADVKTEERMKFELGGMLGKMVSLFGGGNDGTVTTVAVKGPRQSIMSDAAGQLIDL